MEFWILLLLCLNYKDRTWNTYICKYICTYVLWPIYCNGIRLVPNHLSQSTHLQMWMTQCVFLYQIHCLQNTLEDIEWMYLTIQRTYICLLLFDNRPTNTDKTTKRGSAYCLNVNLIYLRNNMLLYIQFQYSWKILF